MKLAYMEPNILSDRLAGCVTEHGRIARVEGSPERGFFINTGGYSGGKPMQATRHARELLECVEAMQLLREDYPDAFAS